MEIAHAVVDADGSGPCDKVLGKVLGWFPALEVDGQVECDANGLDVSEEVHTPLPKLVVDLLAGAFIEPSGGGFDFNVRAQGVGFGVEVLKQDRQAVFPILQDVFEATASAGLQAERDLLDCESSVEAGFVFGGNLGEDFGFQASLEQLSYGIRAGPKDVDLLQVHLLAFRTDEEVPFSDFAGGGVDAFEVSDFHLCLTVVLSG